MNILMIQEIKTFKKLMSDILKNQEEIKVRLSKLENKMVKLGVGCKTAFEQTKTVINALSEDQKSIREDLAEYGGTITEATFF